MSRTWYGSMIAADAEFDGAPLLRGEVEPLDGHGPIQRATLRVSSLGVFEAFIAGRAVSDEVLSPGWSSYEWRLRFRAYDVTDLVAAVPHGPIVIGVALGNGWYRGRLGFTGKRAIYGDELAAIAELDLVYADGHTQHAGTDNSWRAGPSPVTRNDLYDGQTIDARRHGDGWLTPGYDLSNWTGVHAVAFDTQRLTAYLGPVVRRQEIRAPVRTWTDDEGRLLADFGQNVVGWVSLVASGERGHEITVRYAEVLADGALGTRPLRTARATDTFILSGGRDLFEPTLTYHGFRYAEISHYPGDLPDDALRAVVVHSDLSRTGTFECSDPMLNQLHQNVVWSLRGNFLDLPTDCPQRDERLGWTGDIAVFAPSAAFLYDVGPFLDDWLVDLACEQSHGDGVVPFVVPDCLKYEPPSGNGIGPVTSTAVWSDAAVWVPWALWHAYGDEERLAKHYPAMNGHVNHVAGLLSPSGLWDTGFQFGDWLDPTAPPDQPFLAKANPGVVATVCFYRSVLLTLEAARTLGKNSDVGELTALAARVRRAFRTNYVAEDGKILSDCPTVYALSIAFDILDGPAVQVAGQRLAELCELGGYRVATGFAGTPFVLGALTSTGHTDVAYRMLTERSCPSWLYPVTMGATTIWERWDSMLPDGSINPGEMTSFNHYAFGAVADWMHRRIGGVSAAEPGYRTARIAPIPGGGITWAKTSLATPYGTLVVEWDASSSGTLEKIRLEVPEGMTVVLERAGKDEVELRAGHHVLASP